jgi:hypothetical protein
MHDFGVACRRHRESALFEHLQHRGIFRQHLGDQCLQAGIARNHGQVPQQEEADALRTL